MRRFGFSSLRIRRTTAPGWERVTAGPLAGREIFIDRHGNGAWEDMLAGRFDAEIYDAVAEALPTRGGIVWDVGAHIGFHALGFATVVGHTGRVVAFEPNPSNRDRLQQNLEKNGDLAARIDLHPCALSDHEGEAVFAISQDVDSGASSMSFLDRTTAAIDPHTSASWDRVVVPVQTVDSLIRNGLACPNALKIDVEGAELLVLQGALEALRRGRPAVIVEAHSARLAFEVHEWFERRGYQVRLLAELAPSRVLLHATPA